MKSTAALLVLAACQPPPTGELPWLGGFEVTAKSSGVVASPSEEPPEGCGAGATSAIVLVADVAPQAGRETIRASYATGISIVDTERHPIAEAPGYPCEGSVDELDVVAVGHAYDVPMLALAATAGGRRETATFVALFRLPALDPMFTGVVETRVGDRITQGWVQLFPGGLVYARPGGQPHIWRLDISGAYVPMPPEQPHAEPVAGR